MRRYKMNLALVLIFLCTIFSETQAQEGALMLYGSLNYRHNNTDGSSFSANPIGLGYFFNDHVVAGMNVAFDIEKNGFRERIDTKYEVGPFYSDSWKIGDHFFIIAQVDTHYIWGNTLINTADSYSYDGFLARVYPIVAVSLGHGWALKAKFCELSYQQTKRNDRASTRNKTFVAGINGSTFGLGVSKNISFKKKKE